LSKQLYFPEIKTILTVIIILSQKLILFFILCVLGSVGLQRASAQLGPPAAPQVPSPGTGQLVNGPNRPPTTKVVRIYSGTGHFDDALAEKLRPTLAKAFDYRPDPIQPVPGATAAAQAQPDSQKKVAAAAHQ
jgi:hypothetical protein